MRIIALFTAITYGEIHTRGDLRFYLDLFGVEVYRRFETPEGKILKSDKGISTPINYRV